MRPEWTDEAVRRWVDSQDWYQTIQVRPGIVTPGSSRSLERLDALELDQVAGKTVLDVGCNSGFYALESKRRGAARVVGVEPQLHRVEQARTLAEIMGLEVDFHQLPLAGTGELGRFDTVFCIAVLTEVADLIGSLLTLTDLTAETLYLELSVFGRMRGDIKLPFRIFGERTLDWLSRTSIARLRKTKTGWSLAPSFSLLLEILGEEFDIVDLGPSARYRLLRLERRHRLS